MNSVTNSASGTDSQTPVTPITNGSTRILTTMKINVLQNEMIADLFPSPNAVNIADAKILIPANIIKRKQEKSICCNFICPWISSTEDSYYRLCKNKRHHKNHNRRYRDEVHADFINSLQLVINFVPVIKTEHRSHSHWKSQIYWCEQKLTVQHDRNCCHTVFPEETQHRQVK